MSIQKIGVFATVLGMLVVPAFVSAASSHNNRNDRDYRNDDRYYTCDTHGSGACYSNYDYSYPYNYSGYSYSGSQYYNSGYSQGGSPNVALTIVSLPNTGFAPQSFAAIAFALLILLGIGYGVSSYVRKAFIAVLR